MHETRRVSQTLIPCSVIIMLALSPWWSLWVYANRHTTKENPSAICDSKMIYQTPDGHSLASNIMVSIISEGIRRGSLTKTDGVCEYSQWYRSIEWIRILVDASKLDQMVTASVSCALVCHSISHIRYNAIINTLTRLLALLRNVP